MKRALTDFSGKVLAIVTAVVFILVLVGFSGNPRIIKQASASTSTSTTQTINLTVNEVITLTLASTTLTLPALTPGSAVVATTSATVTTNGSAGWSLNVSRTSATSTIASGTITFPDATSWNGTNNATSAANLVNSGNNLSFRLNATGTSAGLYATTTWGATDLDPNAMYAGFPTSSQIYVSTTTYDSTSQTAVMELRANAPATQVATNYTGTITITAIALP